MSAPHDLCQDLNMTGEEMYLRRKDDPKLDELVAEYENAHRRTVDAEETNSAIISDEELTALKATRLKLKDKIVQYMQNPDAPV